MSRAAVTLLGGFDVRLDDGTAVVLPTHKYRALLAYLATPVGQVHPREKLVALLWGDHQRVQGRAALRQAIWALRRALHGAKVNALRLEGDGIALDAAAVEVDVTEFEHAAAGQDSVALARAAALYAGEFLAGLTAREAPFEEWLRLQRERLAETAVGVLARLLAHYREAGQLDAAVQTAIRLLALDPLQEPVHRALMRLYAAAGRHGSALRQYETCVDLLQRELGAEPESETRALYQAIVAQRVSPNASTGRMRPDADERRSIAAWSTPPLIGRATELGLLGETLDGALKGRGHVAAVVGEAGIGKTRLVATLAADAAARGVRVIVGRAYETEQVLPFGPWLDALHEEHISADHDEVMELDYRRMFEATSRLIATLARRQPVLLILEDLHWADEMTLRLAAFVARRAHASLPVLLVLTARQEELHEAPLFSRLLEDLSRDLPVLQLSLGALDRDDTVRLVGALAGGRHDGQGLARVAEGIWTASRGNPFVVVETLRSPPDDAAWMTPLEIPIPERVRRLVERRLDRLGPDARQLVATAAVIGRDFSFSLLQHASGLCEDAAVAGLEELVRRGLLFGTGECFDFVHDRIREVATGALFPERRRLLHRRVGEALENVHAGNLASHAAVLGHHYAEAGLWERAATHLDAAGLYALEKYAFREADVTLRRALDAVGHLPPGGCASMLEADIRLHLLRLFYPQGAVDRIAEQLRYAEPLIATLGDPRREVLCRIFRCDYFHATRDHASAIASARGALSLAQRQSDRGLLEVAHFKLGVAHAWNDDDAQALEHLETALTISGEATPQRLVYPYLPAATALVDLLARLGRFSEARSLAEEMMRLAEARAPHSVRAPSALGALHLHRGEAEQAIPALERALELCREQHFFFLALTLAQLGLAYALAGRSRDAARLLDESLSRRTVSDIPVQEGRVLPVLAHTALALGRPDEARRLAKCALDLAIEHGERGNEATARVALGAVAVADPNATPTCIREGVSHLRAARGIADRFGWRPLAAHVRLHLGMLLARDGESAAARAEIAEALAAYRTLGMRYWADRAERMHT